MPDPRTTRPAAPQRRGATGRMREEHVEDFVAELCKMYGLWRIHILRPIGSTAGWPDDVIAGPGGIIFRELKQDGKYPTAIQAAVLGMLAYFGFDVGVWREEDIHNGRIQRELQALKRRQPGREWPPKPFTEPDRPAAVKPAPTRAKCGCSLANAATGQHTCVTWGGAR